MTQQPTNISTTLVAASASSSAAPRHDVVGAVLCAGLGTRLRPATAITPKPAVPFCGSALAIHSVAAMARAGVRAIGCNLHHLPEAMREALEPVEAAGLRLVTNVEAGPILGTGGGVRELWKALGTDKTLVVCHGDVVLGLELAPVIAAHQASGALATLVLKLRDGTTTLGGVFTDAAGRIARILSHERPAVVPPLGEHAFTGIQVLSPEVFRWLPETGPSCLVTEVYPRMLAADRPLGCYLTTAFYADLGTFERYLRAQREVFEAPARLPGLTWPRQHAPQVWLDETVVVEDGAVLRGPVRLEGAVVVRAGAEVGPDVACTGSIEIAHGARLRNTAVWGRGRIATEVADTLVSLLPEESEDA